MKKALTLLFALALAAWTPAQAGGLPLLGVGKPSVAAPGGLPLDTGTAASRAFSLRKLRTAYAGNVVTVKRASDSTSSTIGFSGNVIDSTTLLTFCAATNCVVTTGYDQSGNARDWTAISGSEPQIVASGSLVTKGGFPSLNDSTGQMGFSSTGASTTTPLTILGVWAATTPTADRAYITYGNGSSFGFYYGTSTGGTANGKQSVAAAGCCRVFDSSTALTANTLFQGGVRADGTNYKFWLNGSPDGTGTYSQSFTAYTAANLGVDSNTTGGNGNIGYITEEMEFTSALTDAEADAKALEEKTYYGL